MGKIIVKVADEIQLNEFWKLKRFGPHYYSARSNNGEKRLYFTRYSLERDFGKVEFPDEMQSHLYDCGS